MKIVIDIPDDWERRIKCNIRPNTIECGELVESIWKGKMLPKSKWIPVSERLPEEAGVYLVSMNRLGYPQRAIDGFICGRWEIYGNAVLAWMPLQEAYEESEV